MCAWYGAPRVTIYNNIDDHREAAREPIRQFLDHYPFDLRVDQMRAWRARTELEICDARAKLARVRALVARADHLLATVLACGENGEPGSASVDADLDEDGRFAAAVLATLRTG